MKMNCFFVAVIVVILMSPAGLIFAGDRTPTQVANAQSFALESVKLGMTEEDFFHLFPNARPFDSMTDEAIGIKGFRVDETQNTDGIDISFYKGKLFSFYARYSSERTNGMGGYETILSRLAERFGKGEADSKGTNTNNDNEIFEIKWRVPPNFFCEVSVETKMTRIWIVDSVAADAVNKEHGKKANLGF